MFGLEAATNVRFGEKQTSIKKAATRVALVIDAILSY